MESTYGHAKFVLYKSGAFRIGPPLLLSPQFISFPLLPSLPKMREFKVI